MDNIEQNKVDDQKNELLGDAHYIRMLIDDIPYREAQIREAPEFIPYILSLMKKVVNVIPKSDLMELAIYINNIFYTQIMRIVANEGVEHTWQAMLDLKQVWSQKVNLSVLKDLGRVMTDEGNYRTIRNIEQVDMLEKLIDLIGAEQLNDYWNYKIYRALYYIAGQTDLNKYPNINSIMQRIGEKIYEANLKNDFVPDKNRDTKDENLIIISNLADNFITSGDPVAMKKLEGWVNRREEFSETIQRYLIQAMDKIYAKYITSDYTNASDHLENLADWVGYDAKLDRIKEWLHSFLYSFSVGGAVRKMVVKKMSEEEFDLFLQTIKRFSFFGGVVSEFAAWFNKKEIDNYVDNLPEQIVNVLRKNLGVVHKDAFDKNDKDMAIDFFNKLILDKYNTYFSGEQKEIKNLINKILIGDITEEQRESLEQSIFSGITQEGNMIKATRELVEFIKQVRPDIVRNLIYFNLQIPPEKVKEYENELKKFNGVITESGEFIADPRVNVSLWSKSEWIKYLNIADISENDRKFIEKELKNYVEFLNEKYNRAVSYVSGLEDENIDAGDVEQYAYEWGAYFDPDTAKSIVGALQRTASEGNKFSIEQLLKHEKKLYEMMNFSIEKTLQKKVNEKLEKTLDKINKEKITRDELAAVYGIYARKQPVNSRSFNLMQIVEKATGSKSVVDVQKYMDSLKDKMLSLGVEQSDAKQAVQVALKNNIGSMVRYLGAKGYGKGAHKNILPELEEQYIKPLLKRVPSETQYVMDKGAPVAPMDFVVKIQSRASTLTGGGFYINLVATQEMVDNIVKRAYGGDWGKFEDDMEEAQEHKHYFDPDSYYTIAFARLKKDEAGDFFALVMQSDLYANSEKIRPFVQGWQYYLIHTLRKIAELENAKMYLITGEGEKKLWKTISLETAEKAYDTPAKKMKLPEEKYEHGYGDRAYRVANRLAAIANKMEKIGMFDEGKIVDYILKEIKLGYI